MADTKISSATNTTALVSTDMFPLARSADATARKVTFANLFADTDTDIAAANSAIAALDVRVDDLEAAPPTGGVATGADIPGSGRRRAGKRPSRG